jgi:DNA polymerase III alpha subunit (gram-positive type)
VSRKQVERCGGRKLFDFYPSLSKAIRTLYPEEKWDASLFLSANRKANKFWTDKDNQKQFLERIALELGIQEVTLFFSSKRQEKKESKTNKTQFNNCNTTKIKSTQLNKQKLKQTKAQKNKEQKQKKTTIFNLPLCRRVIGKE